MNSNVGSACSARKQPGNPMKASEGLRSPEYPILVRKNSTTLMQRGPGGRIAEYRRSGIALPILMPVESGPDSMAGVVETLHAGAG
jgi:hypothetical protein